MSLDYIFTTGEPGILVEIHLPKKAAYQKKLYKTLTEGFTINTKNYFSGRHKAEIREFLRNYDYVADNYDGFIDPSQKVFYGYSMYEVDGVFYNSKQKKIDEERTQIIRLIFKPEIDEIWKQLMVNLPKSKITRDDVNYLVRHFLRSSYRNRKDAGFEDLGRRNKKGIKNIESQKILDLLQRWKDLTGLFLFGYIVFQLTKGVNKIEDEIWISSSWNLVINRIIKP